jgi:lipopolysaccharide biosynthesis protein
MPLPTLAKTTLFHLLRTGFRLLPLPAAARDRMRQRFLERHSDLVPVGPRGQIALGTQQEHRPRIVAGGPAIGYRHRTPGELPNPMPAILVAFYLPQFHPIPENDAWWGTGFTEWKNVARALPQFEGHAQPRLPGELGFYDLRVADVMRQQMQLAREYGIGAFCSYFYWFGGKTLLEQPLQQWLSDPTMDLPLCLCWANENWSRRWDGRADEILIGQQHSAEDDIAFIAHVARYLADPRYLRTDGKPMLLIYRPGLLPEPSATAARWRSWCRQHGLGEIYLSYVQSFDRIDPREIGFDAAVSFPPNNTTLKPITSKLRLLNPQFSGDVYDWRELAHAMGKHSDMDYPLFPCVNPGWDNEPRRSGNGRVFTHASTRVYSAWLLRSIAKTRRRNPTSPLVFINAWNEWAEGAVLEPDTRLGFAWLDATRRAVNSAASATKARMTQTYAIIHVCQVDPVAKIVTALSSSGIDWRLVFTTGIELEMPLREYLEQRGIKADVIGFKNCSNDILPFLHVADQLLDEGADVVLKLRTSSASLYSDSKWLEPTHATRILGAFQASPGLGLIAAQHSHRPLDETSTAEMGRLAIRLGIPVPTNNEYHNAGDMFWVRLDALRPILDAHLGVWELMDQKNQADNALICAVEHMIGPAVTAAGYHIRPDVAL